MFVRQFTDHISKLQRK